MQVVGAQLQGSSGRVCTEVVWSSELKPGGLGEVVRLRRWVAVREQGSVKAGREEQVGLAVQWREQVGHGVG